MAFHNFFPGAIKRVAGHEFILGVPDEETGLWPLIVDGEVVMTATTKTIMAIAGSDDFPISLQVWS